MIQLYNVSKTYDGAVPALDDVSVSIEKGEFVFVTGGSGAGKSTLLKIIFGAEAPTSGHIILEGRNYLKIPPEELPFFRRRVGFVFQDFKLITSMTVGENVALALKVMGVNPYDAEKRALKALSYVKLQHRANFRPLTLSGGEQQRVSLARAIVRNPAILLADEPTGNLDHELAMEMMALFGEINSRGTTVIVATHDKALMSSMNKRTIVLEAGRLVN